MRLRSSDHDSIAGMRREKISSLHVPLLPGFHQRLAGLAEVFELVEGSTVAGYVLVLIDRHEDHDHVTLIELHLTPPFQDRYEDAVDLIKQELAPRAYLARTNDCTFETALAAHGFLMEISVALMVDSAPLPPGPPDGLALVPLDYPYLTQAQDLYQHAVGPEHAPTVAEMEQAMEEDGFWVLTKNGEAIGLILRELTEDGRYCQLDILAPHALDTELVWALRTASKDVETLGLVPAAAIEARNPRKWEIFRSAGYHTAASYLIFYDPEAGRPSVGVIGREQLWAMLQAGERVRVVDVLGEDHWKRGHLPGAEWLDFRSLSREARSRFQKDEPIVVYCSDYT